MRRWGRWASAAVLSTAMVVAGACGDGDDAAASDVGRYCEIAQELAEAADDAFAGLLVGPFPDEATRQRATNDAFERFYGSDEVRELEDEMRSVAPEPIHRDVGTITDAHEQLGETGVVSGRTSGRLPLAQQRVREFEGEHCGGDGATTSSAVATTTTEGGSEDAD